MVYNKQTRKEHFLKMIDNSGMSVDSITREELLNDMEECHIELTKNTPMPSTNRVKLLEKQWYNSLPVPDYSVYSHENYFIDVFICWIHYSRGYIKKISKLDIFNDIDTIVDLGCGPGFTTKELNEVFKPKRTVGTNIKYDKDGNIVWQWNHAKSIGIEIVEGIKDVDTRIDLVVAFEYFEHIEDPIEHLKEVLSCSPRFLVVRNGFNSAAIGHFFKKSDRMSIKFNKILREYGYNSLKKENGNALFFNNMPVIWEKEAKRQNNPRIASTCMNNDWD